MFITTDAKKFETSLPALIMPKSFFMPLSFSPVLVERSALSSSRTSSAICGKGHEGEDGEFMREFHRAMVSEGPNNWARGRGTRGGDPEIHSVRWGASHLSVVVAEAAHLSRHRHLSRAIWETNARLYDRTSPRRGSVAVESGPRSDRISGVLASHAGSPTGQKKC